MAKSTGCSSRRPRFSSQNTHGSSQLSVPLVLEDLTPPHRHKCRQNINAYEIKINKRKNKNQVFPKEWLIPGLYKMSEHRVSYTTQLQKE